VLEVLVLVGLRRLQMEVILYFPLSLPQVVVAVEVAVAEVNKPKMVGQVAVVAVVLQLLVVLETHLAHLQVKEIAEEQGLVVLPMGKVVVVALAQ
jgi:ABC-type transport system involved in cytochrome c biogenesis permease component